jgi:hypothetical protein
MTVRTRGQAVLIGVLLMLFRSAALWPVVLELYLTDIVDFGLWLRRSIRRRLIIKMPDPKDDPKSSEWRPYIFAREQWHCRICGDRFLYSEMVRKHIANEHNETMPPSMYEYFHGAVWQRKKLP